MLTGLLFQLARDLVVLVFFNFALAWTVVHGNREQRRLDFE